MESPVLEEPKSSNNKWLYILSAFVLGGLIVFFVIKYLYPGIMGQPLPVETPQNQDDALNATEESSTTRSIPQSAGSLSVNSLPNPIQINAAELGLPVISSDSGIEPFSVYQVGTIESDPYKGDKFYLIERQCEGPCGKFHYRVIDDRGKQGLVFLKNFSNEPDAVDLPYFVQESGYDIPELRLPKELFVEHEGKTLVFEEEEFNPAVRFEYFTEENGETSSRVSHPVYGHLYEKGNTGYFIAKRADHTVKLYRLKFPFRFTEDPNYGYLTPIIRDFYLSNAEGDSPERLKYTPVTVAACPPINYKVYPGSLESRLNTALPFDFMGQKFYKLKNPNDEIYKQEHEYYSSLNYEEFVSEIPIVFWKDALGRFIGFRNLELSGQAETECPYFNSVI